MNNGSISSPVGNDSLDTANLQADVMRFLAMVALTLLAVSTIGVVSVSEPTSHSADMPAAKPAIAVQPAPPEPRRESPQIAAPIVEPVENQGSTKVVAPIVTPVPEPAEVPAVETAARMPRVVRAAPAVPRETTPAASREPPAPRPAIEAAHKQEQGFTLRFESDSAFRAALRRNHARLFAKTGTRAWRFDAATWQFVRSSEGARAHGVSGSALPGDLVAAITKAAGSTPDNLTGWAVSLDGPVVERLASAMNGQTGGQLVLDGKGQVRLSQQDTRP
jgi:hypothetical protein